MVRSHDDYRDFEDSVKSRMIAQSISALIGIVFGLITGPVIGLAIGFAVGGPVGLLVGLGIGLILGPIFGFMIAAAITASPHASRKTDDREFPRNADVDGSQEKNAHSHITLNKLSKNSNQIVRQNSDEVDDRVCKPYEESPIDKSGFSVAVAGTFFKPSSRENGSGVTRDLSNSSSSSTFEQ